MNVQGLKELRAKLQGDLLWDGLTKSMYATDASVYRRIPLAVAIPKHKNDLKAILKFANANACGIILRTAGTSLAGQCVGDGIVVDVSKYFNQIISLDKEAKTVKVQPGVIRDDLNRYLKPFGLFFGPITATANRCMIGGMVGNNSSGASSIKYGVTRDKLVSMKTMLWDGSEAVFTSLEEESFHEKRQLENAEGKIYRDLYELLKSKETRQNIKDNFPKESIHRRNTGYAIDCLIKADVFDEEENAQLNICNLLAGSEGTLAITTEITLQLDPLPPRQAVMIAAHFNSVADCLAAVVPAMQHDLYACEMMDKTILDCTKGNIEQSRNRFFLEGDPEAILMMELRSETESELLEQQKYLIQSLNEKSQAYAMPVLKNEDIIRAHSLRSAGLGLLANLKGDKKAVACIEDTAVALEDLADYISEFTQLMQSFDQRAVYYAHAGAGELHLRPILDLKKSTDLKLFKEITDKVAELVKKYKGSMSGEHGDGIVRASYIPYMLGEKNYEILKHVKSIFDPNGILNPGKIVDAFPMDKKLRYETERAEPIIESFFNFDDTEGILRAAEKCNGSGDCRKSIEAGGTMCPSYRATKDEKDTTRGRANALREFLTNSTKVNKYDHEELKEVMDLCLSCKGCTSECPSNVDMASLKAEFEYQYQKTNGIPVRSKLFALSYDYNKLGRKFRPLTNFLFKNTLSSTLIKKTIGIASQRQLPILSKKSMKKWLSENLQNIQPKNPIKSLYFFVDEFCDQLDTSVAIDAIELLTHLGYEILIEDHAESGRAAISKGMLEKAREVADINIHTFADIVSEEKPLVGIEPSCILSFRDEYPRISTYPEKAKKLATNTLMIDEFLHSEILKGNITEKKFTQDSAHILLHGHCHQKALSSVQASYSILDLPKNYSVNVIPSGCCGMAGSFGYEKEHYNISMQIGEHTLFPAVRNAGENVIVSAPGTSCRHQIIDGTGKSAFHPVSILRKAIAF